jgi:GMP synthase (glutamine-hydrolysing)
VTEGKDLPDERIQRVLDGIDPDTYEAACEAKRLFGNFTDFVWEVRQVRERSGERGEADRRE